MNKQYLTSSCLQIKDSELYAIFPFSDRKAEKIALSSWLTIMELFVIPRSLATAYEIFKVIEPALLTTSQAIEINRYRQILRTSPDAFLWLLEGKITLVGQGIKSLIDNEELYALEELSREVSPILPKLLAGCQWQDDDDIDAIADFETFSKRVEILEHLGLLAPARGSLNWGDFQRSFPMDWAFGLSRGTPIDRYYLDKFVQTIRPQVMGDVLEIGAIAKTQEFYQFNEAGSYKVLNLESSPIVDIIGDVHDPSAIEPESFDTIVIFNVLEHCYAPWIAVENIYNWLKFGGKCVAMVPNAVRVHKAPADYWRPLPDGFAWMFRQFSQKDLFVYGNPTSVTASYYGIAAEELTAEELDTIHPDYPVATCILAQK